MLRQAFFCFFGFLLFNRELLNGTTMLIIVISFTGGHVGDKVLAYRRLSLVLKLLFFVLLQPVGKNGQPWIIGAEKSAS